MDAFNGAQLRLARVFNGFALEEVAERVEKTRQYIHRLETLDITPTRELAQQLAEALRVEPAFFLMERRPFVEEQFHFRKLLTTRAGVKQTALARGELFGCLVAHLDRELNLPAVNIPTYEAADIDDIEQAADGCRKAWGLGMGPIADMTRVAEHVGAVVTSFAGVSTEIDALSVVTHRPIIVRNEAKLSACRQRFDIAHELGHFVLHQGKQTGDRVTEGEANRFASALLVPRSMMAKLFPRPKGSRLDWVGLRDFKMTWKVSKAALLYRARTLALISDDQYKTGVITLRRHGEANGEHEDTSIPQEQPELLRHALQVLAERKGQFVAEVAHALRVTPSVIEDLAGFKVIARPAGRPQLKVVG